MQPFVVNRPVFIGSVGITAAFLSAGVLVPSQAEAEATFAAIKSWILATFGWFCLLTVAIFVGYSALEAAQGELMYEARTFFSDGSRGYDLIGMTSQQLISDLLHQFERYLNLVQSLEAALVTSAPEHIPDSRG